MIDYDAFCKIKKLRDQDGLRASQIAAEMAMDVRTVAKWLEKERFEPRKDTAKASILDPFKDEVNRLLERHSYTATQVFQMIREEGYSGGYNTVKRYVHKVRPRRAKAYLKLAFAPGECAQVDCTRGRS